MALTAGWLAAMPAVCAADGGATPAQLLLQADDAHTTDHARFLQLMDALRRVSGRLTPAQRWHLALLEVEQHDDTALDAAATPQLEAIINRSGNPALVARALSELVEINYSNRHYEQAYALAERMLAGLPAVTDPLARMSVLNQAVQMMDDVGQYDLAGQYARQMRAEFRSGKGQCWAMLAEVRTDAYAGKVNADSPRYQRVIDQCLAAGQVTFANALRLDIAGQLVAAGHPDRAITLLRAIAPSIAASGYRFHIASLPVTLAQAYVALGDDGKAARHAREALALVGPASTSWIVLAANKVLYQVAKRAGHGAAALAHYEKYAALDKAATDDAGARALAYQEVRQDVLATRLKVDALGKQNRILELNQRLAAQTAENQRLLIALLLACLAIIGLVVFWLVRSRRRFRRLARHDGLTGVLNRVHFLDEAGRRLRRLRRLRKARAGASLTVVDLDHFKQVNDTWGHVAGDVVLRQTVAVMQRELGTDGLLGRLGGEEFGLLVPAPSRAAALAVVDRVRVAVAAKGITLDAAAGTTIHVSASLGLAYCPDAACTLREMLIAADAAVYRAKDAGRNRVVANDVPAAASGAPAMAVAGHA